MQACEGYKTEEGGFCTCAAYWEDGRKHPVCFNIYRITYKKCPYFEGLCFMKYLPYK